MKFFYRLEIFGKLFCQQSLMLCVILGSVTQRSAWNQYHFILSNALNYCQNSYIHARSFIHTPLKISTHSNLLTYFDECFLLAVSNGLEVVYIVHTRWPAETSSARSVMLIPRMVALLANYCNKNLLALVWKE